MAPISSTLSSLVAPVVVAILVAKLVSWHQKVKTLPPGPIKLPLIDNLFNAPTGLDYLQFHELAKQHGTDIIHFGAPGFSIIVLDTVEAANDLLDNRSGIYSSRVYSVMLNELSGVGNTLALMPYGDLWRSARRMFTKYFGAGGTKVNRHRELFYTRRCLSHLLKTPDDFLHHLQYLVGSISLAATYGLQTRSRDDEHIRLAAELVSVLGVIEGAGIFLVDVFPILKYIPNWFPGATFQRLALKSSALVNRSSEALFAVAKSSIDTANYTPSLVTENLQGLTDVSEVQPIKDVALTVYLAGTDTTWSALGSLMLAMTCYPEVQKKLQEELDSVLHEKLPEHKDIVDLPYLTAVFMEVVRWRPTLPVGLPHATTHDDVYKGYFIPKGSIVIANQWAMLQDPSTYPEPTKFNPERFLRDGQIDPSVQSPLEIGFGFGRRSCPGKPIAQSTFMIAAASIFAAFNVRIKKDANGRPIPPAQDYVCGFIAHPKDFPCVIEPRSLEAKQLITSWVAAEGDNPP